MLCEGFFLFLLGEGWVRDKWEGARTRVSSILACTCLSDGVGDGSTFCGGLTCLELDGDGEDGGEEEEEGSDC